MFSGNLREATRSVHVSYPVPYLATALLLAGLTIIGLATAFSGWEKGLLLGFAGSLFLVALFIVVWSVSARPDLLKSEKYVLLDRIMTGIGDKDMDPQARERLQMQVLGSLTSAPGQITRPSTRTAQGETRHE
jgi:hypothetical protein